MTTRRARIGIADVAEAAGVSKTAVSFAFNNPDRLSDETAARIRVVADELGYRPDPVARMLTRGETRTIGVLTPQPLTVSVSNPFFGALAEGIAAVAEASDYGLNLISPLGGSLARAVSRATVDGIVAIGLSADHPDIEQIRRTGLPIVLVDSTAMADQPSVGIDDQAGAQTAAEHLVGLGHRDFLVISIVEAGASPHSVPADRLAGYRSALTSAGIALTDDRVETDTSTVAGGAQAFGRAWTRGMRPTAVLAMSDAMAMGVIRAAAERGLGVPSDLSVVGFDDVDVSAYINPPLTTIHQPIRRKGEEAVRLLLAAIERRAPGRDHLRLDTHLIIRASTGPAPASSGR
jgi:DNA-binding LacI/PurR family transcriptional regulator